MKKFIYFVFFIFCSMLGAVANDMCFVQIDGLKYNPNDVNSVQGFQKIVKEINSRNKTDFVVFTGDNIEKSDKTYLVAFLKASKKLKVPFYVVLGSKDVNKRNGLSKDEYCSLLRKNARAHRKIKEPNYSFEKNGILFVVVDGSKEVIALSNGYYKPDVLSKLQNTLSTNKDKKVVILQHFPIIPPAEKESRYTFKADEYLKMLTPYKNVKAIVAGHFGVNNEQTINGIVHIATEDAPTYRIIDVIDYDTENPTFWSTIIK